MKKFIVLSALVLIIAACGGGGGESSNADSTAAEGGQTTEEGNPSYDPKRGEGKFENVEVSPTLDKALAEKGQKVADLKCTSCHKLTDERLVGPGWAGVTKRHTPEWIMNFMTNTDAMIDKDPKVQAMLEICMVRMPNQNLSDDDARSVYEYMREVDGVK